MSTGLESPQQIFAIDDGHYRRRTIRQQPDPQKSETGKPCQRIGTFANASVTGREQGSREIKNLYSKSKMYYVFVFLFVRFFPRIV